MSSPICVKCGESKPRIWWCRVCRIHFCGEHAGGGFFSFRCPEGHNDVVKVKG